MTPASFTAAAHVEVLSHRSKTHRATIRVVQVADGWVWAVDCMRLTGGVCGWAEPLSRPGDRVRPARIASSRGLALSVAADSIRTRMPDPGIVAWLDTRAANALSRAPSGQPDLFHVLESDR